MSSPVASKFLSRSVAGCRRCGEAISGPGLTEFTDDVARWLESQGIATGVLTVYIRHTSASLIIQENADGDVMRDIETFFNNLVAQDLSLYRHKTEGADDMPAHIKGALTETSLNIPVNEGRLGLGTWQGIFLFEHRARPYRRTITLHLIGE